MNPDLEINALESALQLKERLECSTFSFSAGCVFFLKTSESDDKFSSVLENKEGIISELETLERIATCDVSDTQ